MRHITDVSKRDPTPRRSSYNVLGVDIIELVPETQRLASEHNMTTVSDHLRR